jgi:hypothetical protein
MHPGKVLALPKKHPASYIISLLFENLMRISLVWTKDGNLGHQFNRRLGSFAPRYSQSLLLADFKKTIFFFGYKNPFKKIPRNKKKSLL